MVPSSVVIHTNTNENPPYDSILWASHPSLRILTLKLDIVTENMIGFLYTTLPKT